MNWVEHSIWWQVYPLGFVGADPTGADRSCHRPITAITGWLDYVQELGLSGLALNPVFASTTHGYDITDHFALDERLGSEQDLAELIAACHERGIKVMFDGVFNHVSRQHPKVVEALAEGPGSSAAELFRIQWPENWQPGQPPTSIDCFEGHEALVALNHESEAVADLVTEAMCHWLERGIDAWRLDAAYAVPNHFWTRVLPRVRERHPQVYVVGEVLHGDYGQVVSESGMDSVTQYELWKAIWSGLRERNFFETAWSIKRHNDFLARFVPWTFVGNHDVSRLASQVPTPEHQPHAAVMLFTLGGTPAIYYGDEQAFTGEKTETWHGDDAVRPPLPDSPDELLPFGWPTYRLHQELVALRRRNPWLHTARTEQLHLTNTQFAYRSSAEGGSLVVALNLDATPAGIPVDQVSRVDAGAAEIQQDGHLVVLPPNGWAVLA